MISRHSEMNTGEFKINGVSFNYGAFISAVINFLIIAFILFLLLKAVNAAIALGKKKEEEKPAEPPKEEVLLTEIRDLLKAQAETTESKKDS